MRSALQDAASIASLLLTTEAVECEIAGGKAESGTGGMDGGMDVSSPGAQSTAEA